MNTLEKLRAPKSDPDAHPYFFMTALSSSLPEERYLAIDYLRGLILEIPEDPICPDEINLLGNHFYWNDRYYDRHSYAGMAR